MTEEQQLCDLFVGVNIRQQEATQYSKILIEQGCYNLKDVQEFWQDLKFNFKPLDAKKIEKLLSIPITTTTSAPVQSAPATIKADANDELAANLKKSFEKYDKDNSGFVELKEFYDYVRDAQLITKKRISTAELQNFMQNFDTNKDNKISFAEFLAWWKSNLGE